MSLVIEGSHHHQQQGLDRLSSKRKLDDYGSTTDDDDDDQDFLPSDLISFRMRKDEQPYAVNSTSSHLLPTHFEPRVYSHSPLQFFVRMISEGTLVLHAHSKDSVKSIHERIQSLTGIPVIEQRLIYRGKQLQWENTLADCSVQNDAELQLVGRMRSTHHPQAWQVIDETVSLICRLCKGQTFLSNQQVKNRITEFLNMTPRNDSEKAVKHFQVFLSASVPAVLVMLYMSPYDGNKDCAEEMIRQFVDSSENGLPKNVHSLCAPVVLEFCKLLSRAAENDPLYLVCRSSLGSMVECVGVGRGSSNNGKGCEEEALIVEQEIYPFVLELAAKLSKDLESSMESPGSSGPSASDVRDFTAFLAPLRAVIKERVGFQHSGLSGGEGEYSLPCYGEEGKFLHAIFTDLFGKVERCLVKMEEFLVMKEKGEVEPIGHRWCQCLAILKELNSISELYEDTKEQFWTNLRHRRVSVCYLIVRYAKRTEDHGWLLQRKDVTDFESRRHLALMMLPELKDEYDELHEMLIDRSQLLTESFEYIAHADPETLRSGLFMEFKNEEATGPGVLREWFFLACQAIFNPQNALFAACPNDRRRFFPNPGMRLL